jgi:GDP-4-dehydro-6-deoxy-D-mannose reductase
MADVTLVTGGAGFAGSHLIERLTPTGAPIVAWRRPTGDGEPKSAERSRQAGGTASRVEWRAVDLLDRSAVRKAVADIRPSAVYHCGGMAHVGRAWTSTTDTLATNVRGTHHLIEGLRLENVHARIVIPSSAMVYAASNAALGEDDPLLPNSPYGLSKLAQEMLGRHATGDGLTVTIARAFNHVGPRQNPFFAASGFARRIADIEAGRWEPEITVGNLEARRDLTDVRDTVRAYQLLLERGANGRAYNVCSGRAIAIRELLDMLLARAHVPVRVRVDPARYRPNDVPLVLGNPARIHDELGWRAEIPLERTIDDLLAYWRGQ